MEQGGRRLLREAGWLGTLWLFGLLTLAPFYRSSGGDIPIHTMIHWDTASYHVPTLAYASNAIRHGGEWPLWNFFQHLGSPFMADPQSQLWYPLTWLLSALRDIGTLEVQAMVLLTMVLFGTNTYVAARVFGLRRWGAWCAGAATLVGGYAVGHAAHFGTLTTMAWFPLALALVVLALRGRWLWALPAGAVLGMCSTGGHPTTAFLVGCNVAALMLFCPSRRTFRGRVFLLCALGIVAAMVAAPQVYGVLWAQGVMERVDPSGYPLEVSADLNHLALRTLVVNLLFPGMAMLNRAGMQNIGHWDGFHANDITMTTVYTGLGTLVGVALLLSRGLRGPLMKGLAVLTAVNLLLSFGGATALRPLTYFWLPAFKGPHHASMDFRGFALFGLCLLGARGLELIVAHYRLRGALPKALWRRMAYALIPAGVLASCCIVVGVVQFTPQTSPNWVDTRAGTIPPVLYFGEEVLIQSALLVLLVSLLWMRLPWRRAAWLLVLFVAFDMASSFYRTLPVAGDRAGEGQWAGVLQFERSRPQSWMPAHFTAYYARNGSNGMIVNQVALKAYNPAHPHSIHPVLQGAGIKSTFGEQLRTRLSIAGTEGTARLEELTPNSLTVFADTRAPGTLRVLSTWTPGWRWRAVGEGWQTVRPAAGSPHHLEVPLRAGQQRIELRFMPRFFGAAIGLMIAGYLAAITALAVLALARKRKG